RPFTRLLRFMRLPQQAGGVCAYTTLFRSLTSMTPQIDPDGRLRHLLTLDGLPRETLAGLLDRAQAIVDGAATRPLAGTAICTLRSEEHTSELQSRENLVCRLLRAKKATRT